MSYIRASSNPEGLYIWAEGRQILISLKENGRDLLSIPPHVFHGVFMRWLDLGDDAHYRGASLKLLGARGAEGDHWKWELRFNEWDHESIIAFDSTWRCVANSVAGRTSRKIGTCHWCGAEGNAAPPHLKRRKAAGNAAH